MSLPPPTAKIHVMLSEPGALHCHRNRKLHRPIYKYIYSYDRMSLPPSYVWNPTSELPDFGIGFRSFATAWRKAIHSHVSAWTRASMIWVLWASSPRKLEHEPICVLDGFSKSRSLSRRACRRGRNTSNCMRAFVASINMESHYYIALLLECCHWLKRKG